MSKFGNAQLEKAKMKFQASNMKPERPRIEEQLRLERSLLDTTNELSDKSRKPTEAMFSQLSDKWKGKKGGTGGEAFVTGLTTGLNEGSFMDDKKRYQKLIDFNEKMKNMVADQNVKLIEEENTYNAKKSIEPRVMAYLNSYRNMSPNDRKVYLQNTLDEYNQAAGTNYKFIDTQGSEPWKIIISDNGQSKPLDLMQLIKTPEEKKLEHYYNSTEYKQYEQGLKQEDALDNEIRREKSLYNRSRVEDAEIKRKEHQEALQIEKDILDKTGDHVKFIDTLPTSAKNNAEKHIKEYTEKANQDLAAEKRLQRAIEIATDHPELFGNLNAIISSRYNENPGYLNNLLKRKIPKESQDAMSELAGIVKNIFTDSVKGIGAKGINQFIERKLEAGSPNQRWTAEAFKKVVKEAKDEYSKTYNEHKKVADYGSEGLFYRPRAKSREEKSAEVKPVNESAMLEKLKSIPGITRADIDEAERRIRSGQ